MLMFLGQITKTHVRVYNARLNWFSVSLISPGRISKGYEEM